MTGVAPPQLVQVPRRHGALRRLRAHDRIGPVVVVALVLAALVGVRLHGYGGDAGGFVQFGSALAPVIHPPPGTPLGGPVGYDGQLFWLHARDPLLLHDRTVESFRRLHSEFRASRVAYPALAGLLSLGSERALPWTLLLLDVAAALALTAGTAAFAHAEGRSGWWALVVGLSPGLVLATLRDLSDPLAVAAAAGALMAWRRQRPAAATALLTLAVLAREPMILVIAAIALDAALATRRTGPRRRRSELRRAAPVTVVPLAAWVGWQAYLTARFGGTLPSSTTPPHEFGPPLDGLLAAVGVARHGTLASAAWELAYLLLVFVVLGAIGLAVVRRRTALSLSAAFLAVAVCLQELQTDKWTYTRQTLPLMVLLALVGVAEHRRAALLVPAAAAVLTLLVPLSFGAMSGA